MFRGDRLRKLRRERKLTAKEFGKIFNIAESTVSGYENGSRNPDTEKINLFADFFGCSTDYLLGRSDVIREREKPYYALTEKDERDIAKRLEKLMSDLESDSALAFHGEPMDEETRRLVSIAIENSMRMAREIAKKKFTPKKYRNNNEE